MALSNQPNLMLTKNFHQLQAEVQRHVAADHVAQGSYETCFIGCLARGQDAPKFIQREYGIPLAVSRISEAIFEGLPPQEAALFFAALPDAIESDGKDLGRVVWQFLAAELRLLPPVEPEIQAIIDTVITGMDLLAEGEEWSEEDAKAAAKAARATPVWDASWGAACAAAWVSSSAVIAAADAASAAADWVVSAADWEASAAAWVVSAADSALNASSSAARFDARRRQRDLLLNLIKKAPIT